MHTAQHPWPHDPGKPGAAQASVRCGDEPFRRAALLAGGNGAAAAAGSGASRLLDGLQLRDCRGGGSSGVDGRGSRQSLQHCRASARREYFDGMQDS